MTYLAALPIQEQPAEAGRRVLRHGAVALELLGPNRVTLQGPPLTGSEGFAFMLEQRPGSCLLIGNGDGLLSCMVHHPGFDFNDDNIAVGSAFRVRLAQRFLTASEPLS